jgi:hypothetical protein
MVLQQVVVIDTGHQAAVCNGTDLEMTGENKRRGTNILERNVPKNL